MSDEALNRLIADLAKMNQKDVIYEEHKPWDDSLKRCSEETLSHSKNATSVIAYKAILKMMR